MGGEREIKANLSQSLVEVEAEVGNNMESRYISVIILTFARNIFIQMT